MKKFLIVVDMQNDFISQALGTPEAQKILGPLCRKIRQWDGPVIYTRDTHGEDYRDTQEGRILPIPHCIRGTKGWELRPEVAEAAREEPVDKATFGSTKLGELLREENAKEPIEYIELIGLCTDICVISNALLLKAFLPETEIRVDADLCAGVTPQSHKRALEAMEACQILV